MGTRGPKSKNDLTIVSTRPEKRVTPPDSMSDDAKAEWHRIVSSLPVNHFNQTQLGMLEQYVKHCVEATHISQLIQATTGCEHIDMPHYDRLLKMQERESRILASLAVRLGFAKTSAKPGRVQPGPSKPWE